MKKTYFITLLLITSILTYLCEGQQSPVHTRLLIKIPTRQRSEQFFKILDMFYKKLSHQVPYHFLISCDLDDVSMNNDVVKNKFRSYSHLTYTFSRNHSKIEAYNKDIDSFIDTFDILLLASDDMQPVMDDYDKVIVEKMLENFPDYDGVLNFHDGTHGEILNTYPVIGKNFYRLFGYAYFPGYKSFFCDEELTVISKQLNLQKSYSDILLRHVHPCTVKGVSWDTIYAKNQQTWDEDKALYLHRREQNFYLYNG